MMHVLADLSGTGNKLLRKFPLQYNNKRRSFFSALGSQLPHYCTIIADLTFINSQGHTIPFVWPSIIQKINMFFKVLGVRPFCDIFYIAKLLNHFS